MYLGRDLLSLLRLFLICIACSACEVWITVQQSLIFGSIRLIFSHVLFYPVLILPIFTSLLTFLVNST
ncbi:hypothetical protein HZS61_015415 [Fusarium oxysporum f. sp. conglutinans]|uniref:Uncharacterized protein n=1 Tax=Fusarium oxysporum f. sp. conglutinans TaxID=100902 RepID=A0A8H6GME8_FUSOX|nr:hypothetical protein HZS61_015415 [Fusarium oxysporum f. sp. conglutinans]